MLIALMLEMHTFLFNNQNILGLIKFWNPKASANTSKWAFLFLTSNGVTNRMDELL
jgi:ABC-type uncharacterized transport system permease subunit